MDTDTYMWYFCRRVVSYANAIWDVWHAAEGGPLPIDTLDEQVAHGVAALCRASWAVLSQDAKNCNPWYFDVPWWGTGLYTYSAQHTRCVVTRPNPNSRTLVFSTGAMFHSSTIRPITRTRRASNRVLRDMTYETGVSLPTPPWSSLDELYAGQAWAITGYPNSSAAKYIAWLVVILPTTAEVRRGLAAPCENVKWPPP